MRASPDNLMRTRLKTGSATPSPRPASERGRRPSFAQRPSPEGERRHLGADREAGETLDDDVLAGGAGEVRAQLLDRLAVVLVGVDVNLVEQHDVVHPRLELALGDLRADVLRL